MLDWENRLKKKSDFERVFERGRWGIGNDLFSLKYMKNDLATARIGFLVGTKVSKKAVVRNKIKRRARSIIYGLLKNGFIKQNYDVVLIAKPPSAEASFGQIESALVSAVKSSKIT